MMELIGGLKEQLAHYNPIRNRLWNPAPPPAPVAEPLRRPRMADVVRFVCEEFDLTHDQMFGPGLHFRERLPRHFAILLCRDAVGKNASEVAVLFGKERTTISRTFISIEKRIFKTKAIAHDFAWLEAKFRKRFSW